MEHVVRIHTQDRIVETKAETGSNLLKFLHKNSCDISSPCGGHGTCGKCGVRVKGLSGGPSEKEKSKLGEKALERGYRLACCNQIESELDVYLEEAKEQAVIVTEGKYRAVKPEPLIRKQYRELAKPDLQDQQPDLERVLAAYRDYKAALPVEQLRNLAGTLREKDFKITGISLDTELVSIEAGDTTAKKFGIAVDIGTTTIAAYLMDLNDGTKTDVYSVLNPQRKFGADVVSRINYTNESQAAQGEMRDTIVECMNEIVEHFCGRNGLGRDDIYAVYLVGNTTMLHFLLGLPARNIAVAPFIPVTAQLHRYGAKELGIRINPAGCAVTFPCVSAYIGADTIAAVLASGMEEDDRISLLLDIGTNGEIVLGNSQWMLSCSTAAGPAFEGANIRNGVGGIRGAIDRIRLTPEVEYTTIGNEKAIGICGSGIVDAVAELLKYGIIDETGRIPDADEIEPVSEDISRRFISINHANAFLLVKGDEGGTDIAITQRDVREMQNAKGAIAAGIRILVKQAGIKMQDIARVYLAGGFGSYINIESALKIGLLPGELEGKVQAIGNAAGMGAVEGLLSVERMEKAVEIKDRIRYIELSSCRDFTDEYVECMLFE